jgi:uncharacterized membrane protein
MSTRLLNRLHALLLVLYLGACVIAWPHLPERMPIHYDFLGRVTSWMRTSAALWFFTPALAVALLWFLNTLGRLAASTPEMWQISRADKERVRVLPPEKKAALGEFVRRATALQLLLVTLTFTGVQLGVYATAVAETERMPWYAAAVILGSLVTLLVLGFGERSELRRRIEAATAEREANSGTASQSHLA